MESLFELEDELRDTIIRYADACKMHELDPITEINNLIEEALKDN